MSDLGGLGIIFTETLSGWVGIGERDFFSGQIKGEENNTWMSFDARITIPNLQEFIDSPDHAAQLDGNVTFEPLGGTFPMRDGVFTLYSIDPKLRIKLMTYAFRFTADDGRTYFVFGKKNIKHDHWKIDVFQDITTLFTTVHQGDDSGAPMYAAGILRFKFFHFLPLMLNMQVPGADTFWRIMAGKWAITKFMVGTLIREYILGSGR
ncbi:hypothetical protein [Desulfomonile tiedjei]|uniref:Uncharacterized protein n=1 Tax=Desulfomonile tiedjei (strain ATCC 49306 / DSM 6799 / DCB-1) TaxID=706587 RepID=I4CAL8_DESTA|nr:hypothetical protein [Desulfomonile tiedjei]AFM26609.1 hypothetical protein Desti_3967 [Desulfomonile tiedjei DSM 6799]